MIKLKYFLLVVLMLSSTSSYAYLGPGMGGGVIAAVVGVFVAIFLALFGILYYPIKRALKQRKGSSKSDESNPNDKESVNSGG